MKPAVTKVTTVPRTQLICCPECYRLISCDALQAQVACHACGTIVLGPTLPVSLDPPAARG